MAKQYETMNGEMVDELTWQNVGLSLVEKAIIRKVARQFPNGAYAAFVRSLDEKGQQATTTTEGTTTS